MFYILTNNNIYEQTKWSEKIHKQLITSIAWRWHLIAVCTEGSTRIRELIAMGEWFDHGKDGALHLGSRDIPTTGFCSGGWYDPEEKLDKLCSCLVACSECFGWKHETCFSNKYSTQTIWIKGPSLYWSIQSIYMTTNRVIRRGNSSQGLQRKCRFVKVVAVLSSAFYTWTKVGVLWTEKIHHWKSLILRNSRNIFPFPETRCCIWKKKLHYKLQKRSNTDHNSTGKNMT